MGADDAGRAACAVAMVGVQLPRYLGARERQRCPPPRSRVLSANLGLGQADPQAVVDAGAGRRPMSLVVQEMTPEAAERDVGGRAGRRRSRTGSIDPRAAGGRHRDLEPVPDRRVRLHQRLRDADAERPDPGTWGGHRPHRAGGPPRRAMGAADRTTGGRTSRCCPTTLRELARNAGAGAVIVAGDLNATYDMLPFRRLLGEGYRDAAEQAGAGLTRTYPSRRWRRRCSASTMCSCTTVRRRRRERSRCRGPITAACSPPSTSRWT